MSVEMVGRVVLNALKYSKIWYNSIVGIEKENGMATAKKLIAAALALATATVWSKTIGLDLRAPATTGGARASAGAAAGTAAGKGMLRETRLAAGAADVESLDTGDTLEIAFFDDVSFELTLGSRSPSRYGRDVFLAATADAGPESGASGVVIRRNGRLEANIKDNASGKTYMIGASGEAVLVGETVPRRARACRCGGTVEAPLGPLASKEQTAELLATSAKTASGRASAGDIFDPFDPSSWGGWPDPSYPSTPSYVRFPYQPGEDYGNIEGVTNIDILVAFDKTAQTNYLDTSSYYNMTNFAIIAVAEMNQALANTELDKLFRFRLAGVYAAKGDGKGDLAAIVNSISEQTEWQKELEPVRNEFCADIVSIMTMKPPKDDDEGEDGGGSDEDDSGMVGLGFSLTKDYFENEKNNFAPFAYNACLVTDVIGQHTITHETGHNMGAGHSDVQKSSPGPQLYDYSSGYYFTASGYFGSSARYCTIMAYEQEDPESEAAVGCVGCGYFSSPNYKYNGEPVGNANHDNDLTLRKTFGYVSCFRGEPFVSPEIGIAVEAEELEWVVSGTTPWIRTTDSSYDGEDSARCTAGKGTSWMETEIVGPVALRFKYRLTTYGGTFRVLCDGEPIFEKTDYGMLGMKWNDSGWKVVPDGDHIIRFEYINPPDGIGGSDTSSQTGVWIDQFELSDSDEAMKCRITFSTNRQGMKIDDENYESGYKLVDRGGPIGELPTPTLAGSRFKGWFGGASGYGGGPITEDMIAYDDTTIYAQWIDDSYTVTFNSTGGTKVAPVAGIKPGTYLRKIISELPKPEREGYNLKGWFTERDGGNKITVGANSTVKVTGDVTYYAHWEWTGEGDEPAAPEDTTIKVDGKELTVPGEWIQDNLSARVKEAGGDAAAALAADAANGRKVWECYVTGLDPDDPDNDFRIVEFPFKEDGTPDLDNVDFVPPVEAWNVPGAKARIVGKTELDSAEWTEVTEANATSFKFFRIEIVLP